MKKTEIVLATIKDLTAVQAIIKNATTTMLEAGIEQWNDKYPNKAVIEKDIKAGELFVAKQSNKCLGTITLNGEQEDQYQNIKWSIPSKNPLVIHRLAVDPAAQGLGIGKQLCHFAEQFAKENNFDAIRLDTYSGNPISMQLYLSLAYQIAEGHCHFNSKPLPFYCYEKSW